MIGRGVLGSDGLTDAVASRSIETREEETNRGIVIVLFYICHLIVYSRLRFFGVAMQV